MLRQLLDNVRSSLGQMTATQKLLIGSLAVIAMMSLFLVVQYTARPSMVSLMADDPNANVVQTLQTAGIDASIEGGQVVVPANQRHAAVTALGESGSLPGDTRLLFQNLIEHQDWKASKEMNRQRYRLALQNELGRVIAGFDNVKSATVIIDTPPSTGLGRAASKSTASATVFTRDGSGLPQATVDAVARLVAGAQSGLDAHDVQVIDGSTGRPRNATDRNEVAASTYLEYQQKVEETTRNKIEDALAYIPGVSVQVSAQVDVTRVQSSTERALPKGAGTEAILESTTDKTETQAASTRSAEPGVRSNQQADINYGGSQGTSLDVADATSTFRVLPGTERRSVVDPRGMPKHLAASVGVPQHWVEALVAQSKALAAADGDEPEPATQAEIEDRFEQIRPSIESAVKLHLVGVGASGETVPGELSVNMIQTVASLPAYQSAGPMGGSGGGFMASLAGGGAHGGIAGAGLVELIVVGSLALVALFMMFVLVRKSGKRPELPNANDIAGIPPALKTPSDLVGEVTEGETPMEGIELGEDDVSISKMREQVLAMIENDSKSAANLVSRWVSVQH